MDDLMLPVMGGFICVISVVMPGIAVLRLPRKIRDIRTRKHPSAETRHASICKSTAQHMPRDNQISSNNQANSQKSYWTLQFLQDLDTTTVDVRNSTKVTTCNNTVEVIQTQLNESRLDDKI